MDNMLHLKWSHLGNNFIESVKLFRRSNLFCDVTLAANESQISCHKVVLSSCSEVFRNMLTQHSNNQVLHPFIHLVGVSTRCINNLITFMYESEIIISQEELPELLMVANNLKVKGLSQSAEPGTWNDLNFADQAEQIAQYDFSSDHETETQADLNSNITSNAINGIKEYQSEETKPVINRSSSGAGLELKDFNPLYLRKSGEKGYVCTKCGYSAKRIRDMKRHVIIHSEVARVECVYCGRSFKNKNSLRTHISSSHKPKKSDNVIEDDLNGTPVEVTPLAGVKTEEESKEGFDEIVEHNSDTLVNSENEINDSMERESLKKDKERRKEGIGLEGKMDFQED